jgi:hypothetical protein
MVEVMFEAGVFIAWVGLVAGAVTAGWSSGLTRPDNEFGVAGLGGRRK